MSPVGISTAGVLKNDTARLLIQIDGFHILCALQMSILCRNINIITCQVLAPFKSNFVCNILTNVDFQAD